MRAHAGPHLLVPIKNSELVASDKSRCDTGSADGIDVIKTVAATILRGKNIQFICGGIDWADGEEKHAAALPLDQRHGTDGGLQGWRALQTRERHVRGGVDVVPPEVTVLDVVQVAAVQDICRALALEFEHDEPAVVTRSYEVDLGVGCKDPKAVLAPVREQMRALGGVPHSDGLVLAVTVKRIRVQDQAFSVVGIGVPDHEVVLGEEQHTADIVGVAAHGVDLPCLQRSGCQRHSQHTHAAEHATLLSPIRQSLMKRSSAPDTMRGCT